MPHPQLRDRTHQYRITGCGAAREEAVLGTLYVLLMFFGIAATPIGMLGSLVATIRFRGMGWRCGAALPLLALAAYVALVIVPDIRRDPTSHNLLPFEIALNFWVALPDIAILWWSYRRAHRREEAF